MRNGEYATLRVPGCFGYKLINIGIHKYGNITKAYTAVKAPEGDRRAIRHPVSWHKHGGRHRRVVPAPKVKRVAV